MATKISKFFTSTYADFALYDNARSISSVVDGLKSSARKCMFTLLDKNITSNVKMSILRAKCSEHTYYLHGDQSLVGVMVGLAQDHVGACNVPLLAKEGNFGTRLGPSPAADRYIESALLPISRLIFRKEDDPVLPRQEFEGQKIEPKHFVPIIPVGLINGNAEGMSIGFAHKIFQRNPHDVIKAIKQILNGGNPGPIKPWFNGFEGTVESVTDKQHIFKGTVTIKNTTQVVITEVFPGMTYNKYCEKLDKLVEAKKIVSYKDLCDTRKDTFMFVVKMTRAQTKGKTEEDFIKLFGLAKKDSENYTLLNEHGIVTVYDSFIDILKEFVEIRLRYYDYRKEHMLAVLRRELLMLKNRVKFIRDVNAGDIVVNKKSKANIEKQLTDAKYDLVDDSYDYLLRMQIWSLTKEKAATYIQELRDKKQEYIDLREKDIKEWYVEELDELSKGIKKVMK